MTKSEFKDYAALVTAAITVDSVMVRGGQIMQHSQMGS